MEYHHFGEEVIKNYPPGVIIMSNKWERSIPIYEINIQTAKHLFSQFDPKLKVANIFPIHEGCRNTNYVVQMKNWDMNFLLRIFPLHDTSWEKEKKLLNFLSSKIPVQQLFYMAKDESIEMRTYGIYEYVEGDSLETALSAGYTPSDQLMIDLGNTLAVLHSHKFSKLGFLTNELAVTDTLPPFETWYDLFLGDQARGRLGDQLVSEIEVFIRLNTEKLENFKQNISLVHGDFRPANLLIYKGKLSCVLDWEFAMAGHPIADIGQLFRRDHYFNQQSRKKFSKAYRETGTTPLPNDWFQLSKLRDLANLLQMINAKGNLPQKYADLKKLIFNIVHNKERR